MSTELGKSFMKKVSQNLWNGYGQDVFRILHSKAFSRYADKTQVVYLLEHDHITHRILHVQLVSHFARTIGRNLSLDLDLIEAISLGHDLGHCPFGHEGEKYLARISLEEGLGAFSHSLQSCRLATIIEPLNLHFETLDGFLCHDGGMRSRIARISSEKNHSDHEKEAILRKTDPEADLMPKTREGAVVKVSDTVSYLVRDIVDAVRLKIITLQDLPKTILGSSNTEMLETLANDIIGMFQAEREIGFSEEVFDAMKTLREFNFRHIYWHNKLKTESRKIEQAFQFLFRDLLSDWRRKGLGGSILWDHFLHSKSDAYKNGTVESQMVVDYIAGMTDGYFLRLFRERFVPNDIEVPHVLPFS